MSSAVPDLNLQQYDAAAVPARSAARWGRRAPGPLIGRRHFARTAGLALLTLATDLLLSAVATAVMGAAATLGVPGSEGLARVAALVRGGDPAPLYFASTLLIGLLVTGNYRQRIERHPPVDLLSGVALGVALVYWAPMRTLGLHTVAVPYLTTVLVLWASVSAGRWLLDHAVARWWPSARGFAAAVFVGPVEEFHALRAQGAKVAGFVSDASEDARDPHWLGRVDQLPAVARRHGADAVMVGQPMEEDALRDLLELALDGGCTMLFPARSKGLRGTRPNLVWQQEQPFFELGAPALRGQEVFLKRLVDFLGAAVGLVVLSPLLVTLAILTKLDSPGPVFFVQSRAGLYGRRFRMLKFRTMHHGADDEKDSLAHLNRTGDPRLFKIPDDPRVTRFGRWMRDWSLDELPQLWNVLVGDMSLVGPRPFFESDLADYEAHHFRRLDVKPGITGLWQVNGRSDVVDFDEVVRLDREYIERWSLWMDLRILLQTLPSVLRRHGAY